jgi:Fur family transcriptional regulator, ferric uptake regulator
MEDQVHTILKGHGLSVTGVRRRILEVFMRSGAGLSHADVEGNTDDQLDRVTVYRTLQSFLEKGIIHAIPSADSAARYALCREDCREGQHHDNHVHFICSSCGKATCLNDVQVPIVALPKGYKATQTSVVVNGTCPNCR